MPPRKAGGNGPSVSNQIPEKPTLKSALPGRTFKEMKRFVADLKRAAAELE